jgi:hypothetical protein
MSGLHKSEITSIVRLLSKENQRFNLLNEFYDNEKY